MEKHQIIISIQDFRRKKVEDWLLANAKLPIHYECSYNYEMYEYQKSYFIFDGHCDNDHNIMFKFDNDEDAVRFKLRFC